MNNVVVKMTEESLKKVSYPNGSAGKEMTSKVPTISPKESIELVKKSLKKYAETMDSIDYFYVLNDNDKLVGVASVKEIVRDDKHKLIDEIMTKELVFTHVQVNKKRVAHLAIKHNIKAVPVLDQKEKFVGVLTSDKLLNILYGEHRKEVYSAVGIVSFFDNILDQGVWHSFVSRLPWILIGLFGGIFSAQVIQLFQGLLSENLILAVFIPLIVYIGNAVGAQTQTFFVRDIAIDPKLNTFLYFIKQLITSSLIGFICGIAILFLVTIFWKSAYIGFVIGLSAFAAVAVSTIIALIVPYMFSRFKKDPAIGSSPFSAILQDLTSIFAYFLIASILL